MTSSALRPKLIFTQYSLLMSVVSFFASPLLAQKQKDTSLHLEYLSEITLVGKGQQRDIMMLPEVVGTKINAGKKNSLIILDQLNTVVANNSMRQILAKVPGIHIWESDGSGIQIGIANRGLSPNRSWEFNIRQNGADISADPYGYPEAYYNPPMQAIQRIQITRGAGALQYGPQFGGLINYVMRDGSHLQKSFQAESQQTVGSFGLLNSYIGLGGKSKNGHYYAFYDKRSANGFRQNSAYETETFYGSVTRQMGKKAQISVDYMRYNMLSQQPGGLTDAQFAQDIKQSFRSRNWFSTPWQTANIKLDYAISTRSRLQAQVFAMDATRHSIGNTSSILVADTINKTTGQYNARDLATDKYMNLGTEISYITHYILFGKKQTLSTGIRYFNGRTERYQKGVGSTGTDANFSTNVFPTALTFNTQNVAWFAEQVIRFSPRFILIPGFRAEQIQSTVAGRTGFNLVGQEIPVVTTPQQRSFFLGGLSAEYHLKNGFEIYANATQNYRPILFSDMQAAPGTEQIDANLKDATGYNNDVGFRGRSGQWLYFDASFFVLQYNNRIGRITQIDNQGKAITLKTNVGNTLSRGVEAVVDIDVVKKIKKNSHWGLPIYVSYSYTHARYGNYFISTKNSTGKYDSINLKGNAVENAPANILRTGFGFQRTSKKNSQRKFITQIQMSYVSQTFSDANNTITPSGNGTTGLIPAYTVWDWNSTYTLSKAVQFKLSVNNLTNDKYFTRRSGGYPGPGLMPSDGRAILFTVGIML
jgi:Fe(3+) dicitrate transport protein